MADNSKKNPKPNNFTWLPPGLLPYLAIILILIGIFLIPYDPPKRHEDWTINQVLEAAESGKIQSGEIQSDPRKGLNWYHISGELIPQSKEKDVRGIAFKAEGRLTDDRFNKLVSTKGVNFIEKPASTLMGDLLVSVIPFVVVIFLLYILFMKQIRMAGRGAMSFGKSRAKMLTHDREKITFADVAGCDEAKEEVQEIVEFLKDPKKFQKIGARIPKGCLMVGPPGTGKTLLAKAVAGEADVPFFSISGSDFVEMFVGVGASRVRDMFEQGRKNAPCLIFIDEIDAVGRQRGAGLGGGNDEREQTLNSLLVEMDGFDGHEGVIIIAATNRPDVLDAALLRPGRFDRQIYIDLPDLFGREEVLKVHAKKIKMDESVDLKVVARNTPGFSGADLKNLLNEGALLAARYNKSVVTMAELDEAKDKISYGRERRKLMDDEDKKITAYHEGGHALVQAVIDDGHLPIHKVTIIPRGQSLGSTMFSPTKDILNHSKHRLLNQICCAMGGRIAEEVIFAEMTSGASSDIIQATKIARHMVCDWGMSSMGPIAYGENQDHIFLGREITRNQNYSEATAQKIDAEIHSIVDSEYNRARDIIVKNRENLEKIAKALLEHETIEGKHIFEILQHGEIKSPVVHSKPVVSQPVAPQPEKEEKAEKQEQP